MDWLDQINEALLAAAEQPWVLLVLLVLCVVDGFFPPIPSESLVVGLAVISVTSGSPSIWLIIPVATVGAWIGDNLAYEIGRRVGTRRFRWMRRPRSRAAFEAAGRLLDRRGAVIIIVGRQIPVGRVAINMTAGATGMHRPTFAALALVSSLLWSGLTVTVGVVAGRWVGDNPVLAILLGMGIALVIGVLTDRVLALLSGLRRDRRRTGQEQPADAPAASAGSPGPPPDRPGWLRSSRPRGRSRPG